MKGKGKGQDKNRDIHGRASGQSPNTPKNPAGTRPHRPVPTSARPCLKCGSRDHESGKSQEPKAQKLHGTGHEFHSIVQAEAFGCENLARGRALLDCGATDTVGSVGSDRGYSRHITRSIRSRSRSGCPTETSAVQSESESAAWSTCGTSACACPGNRRSPRFVVCQVFVRAGRQVKQFFVIWSLRPWYSWSKIRRDNCGWTYSNKCQ